MGSKNKWAIKKVVEDAAAEVHKEVWCPAQEYDFYLPLLPTLQLFSLFNSRATHARALLPRHWLLCHLGLY
jgi:hypothetical protein